MWWRVPAEYDRHYEDYVAEAAKRVKAWEESVEFQKQLAKAQDEIFKATRRDGKPIADQVVVSPKVVHSILGGVEVTC